MSLTTTVAKLAELPYGTGYYLKDGQANLHIVKEADGQLSITAGCDSLQRLVMCYEEETAFLRSQLEETTKETSPRGPSGWQWFWIRLGQLAAIYAAIRYLLPRLLKRISL